MEEKKFSLIDFFEAEFRENGFFLVMISSAVGMLVVAILYTVSELFTHGDEVVSMLSVLFMAAACPIIYILAEASKRAENKNQKQDLVCECLLKLEQIREGVQPGLEYILAEGYIGNESIIHDAIESLDKAFGGDYKFYSINGPCYRIMLQVHARDLDQRQLELRF